MLIAKLIYWIVGIPQFAYSKDFDLSWSIPNDFESIKFSLEHLMIDEIMCCSKNGQRKTMLPSEYNSLVPSFVTLNELN